MLSLDAVGACAVLAVTSGTAAYTVARTTIFKPVREWVDKNLIKWFSLLIGCPYCVVHWLAAVAVLLYRPRPLKMFWPVDLGVAWLFTVGMAAIAIGLVNRAIAPPPAARAAVQPLRPVPAPVEVADGSSPSRRPTGTGWPG